MQMENLHGGFTNYKCNLNKDVFLRKIYLTKQIKIYIRLLWDCNHSCENCIHFCPVAKQLDKSVQYTVEDLENTFKIISKYPDIDTLTEILLGGGEPLLIPNIVEYMEVTRKYFPKILITIPTNGIALPNMDDNFYKSAEKYNITIRISDYPTINKSTIKKFLKEKAYKCEIIFLPKTFFCDFRLHSEPIKQEKDFLCNAPEEGFFLDNYRITKCPILYNIDIINKFYGTNYINQNSAWLDVREAKQMKDLENIFKPNSLCAFHKNQFVNYKNFSNNFSYIINNKENEVL
jgi:organic radical activating enzyme